MSNKVYLIHGTQGVGKSTLARLIVSGVCVREVNFSGLFEDGVAITYTHQDIAEGKTIIDQTIFDGLSFADIQHVVNEIKNEFEISVFLSQDVPTQSVRELFDFTFHLK